MDLPKGEFVVSLSLYRQYRPMTFEEVAGQTAVVDVLKKSLQRGHVAHAYLFSGPRGCGKTSVARLLAKALNCTALRDGYDPCGECSRCAAITSGESLDVVEIDGASNNSVDEIRELKTHVSLSPFASAWKIYIIDEVHMLSISAFNALLKTLEEPPSSVVFILATTEPQKVPATIRSRCQHLPFRRIGQEDIYTHIKGVTEREKALADGEALREIARQADGSLRDALSLLEQAMTLGDVTQETIRSLLGGATRSDMEKWAASVKQGQDGRPFLLLDGMFRSGASSQRILEEMFLLFRDLWICRQWGAGILESLPLSSGEKEYLCSQAPSWEERELSEMMRFCTRLLPQVRGGMRPDVLSGLLSSKVSSFSQVTGKLPQVPAERPVEKESARLPEAAAERPEDTRAYEAAPLSKSRDPKGEIPAEGPDSPVTVSPDDWRRLEESLFSKDFLLYCSLVGTEISPDGKGLEIRFPEEARYCFEILSSERNSFALKTHVEDVLGKGFPVFLSCGDEKRECCITSLFPEEKEDGAETPSFPTQDSPPRWRAGPGTEVDEALQPSQSGASGENCLPFEGLVKEALKWGGGEVILVKKEDLDGQPGVEEPEDFPGRSSSGRSAAREEGAPEE